MASATNLVSEKRLSACIAATLLVIIGASPAAAQQTDSWMSIGALIENSDNIDRIDVGGRDETTIGANLEFQVASDGRIYQLNLDGVLDYSAFENDTFDNEFRGNVFGELILDLAGERLQWIVQDNAGQVRRDVTIPDTPGNRENLNVLRTGPQLNTRLGQRSELTIQGFYQNATYEDSLEDSEGLSGYLSLSRAVSPQTNVSLNASARRTEFDRDDLFSSYDLQEVYIGWQSTGARTQVDLEVGYTEIHDRGVVEDGNMIRLLVSREITGRSTLSFDAVSMLTGNEDAFRFTQQLQRPELATQGQAANAEPFRLEYVGLAWQTAGDRLWADALAYFESREFVQTVTDDRDRSGIRVNLTQSVSERLALGVFGEYGSEEFNDPTEDFDEQVYGIQMFYRPADRVQLALVVSRVDRDTDVANLSFTENIVRFTISYDIIGNRAIQRQRRIDR